MLKLLRKRFDASASQPSVQTETLSADAENQKEVNMTTQTKPVGNLEDVASLMTQLESASAELATANKQIETLTAKLTQLEEAQANAEKLAKEAKLKARSEKAVAALGTEKAEKLLAATNALDDASFEAILAVSTTSMQAEAQSPLFKEAGVEGNADQTALQSSGVMKLLQEQYLKPSSK